MQNKPTPATPAFKELSRFPGYRFDENGIVWTCRRQGYSDTFTNHWRPMSPVLLGRSPRWQMSLRSANSATVCVRLHNIFLEAFHGPRPDGCEPQFLDGDTTNIRPSNLRWRSSADARLWSRVKKSDGCWEWTGSRSSTGYGSLRWNGIYEGAHRVAYRITIGTIPDGMHVLHRCDNRRCCRPDHLFLGTNYDNVVDKMRKGRSRFVVPTSKRQYGEVNGSHKLSHQEVASIRAEYATGQATMRVLADQYAVCGETIRKVVRGLTWNPPADAQGKKWRSRRRSANA